MSLSWHVSNSQNLIAVQNGGTPAFYTTLDLAITNAQNGDTIYIPGGGHTVSQAIDKELHLVGTGCNADSTNAVGITITNGIILKSGADGGSMEGIYALGLQFGYSDISDYDVNGYYIQRCYLSGGIVFSNNAGANHSTNISIIETRIGITGGGYNGQNSIYGSMTGLLFMQNCKIFGIITGFTSSTFQNNIFFFTQQFFNGLALTGTNCSIENNIFFSNHYMSGQNCTFKNNIGIWNNGVYTGSYATNAFGSGNVIEPWADTFVNPDNDDFHLKTTSIGKNGGNDGTDIGIYGGAFPWKEGSVPFNPHFQTVHIAPTTDAAGNLNINIKVAAQDR